MSMTMTVRVTKAMAHGAFVGVTGDLSRLRKMRSALQKQQLSQPSYKRTARKPR